MYTAPCRRHAAAALALTLAGAAALALRAVPPEGHASERETAASGVPRGMVLIPAGTYEPLLRGRDDPERVATAAFWLDARPVTNGEFLDFVRAHPRWQRSRVSPLFAEKGYLADWAGDLELGPQAPEASPVVRVSWFAARAYASWRGKRLPTTAEWERAAAAGFRSDNGAGEPEYRAAAMAWFAQPTPATLPAAGNGRPNFHGARDLLSLVWEWVDDFNTAMVTGESRADTGLERTLFCGAGAAGARDLENYPAFARAAMRSSLRATYALASLGFRCAEDARATAAAALPATSDRFSDPEFRPPVSK
jgi:formylglycine-generating enzyme